MGVKIGNYKLNDLENDERNNDFIFINQAFFWPNNLVQLVDNFMLSNKKRNLVKKFQKKNLLEFNLYSEYHDNYLCSLVMIYK